MIQDYVKQLKHQIRNAKLKKCITDNKTRIDKWRISQDTNEHRVHNYMLIHIKS